MDERVNTGKGFSLLELLVVLALGLTLLAGLLSLFRVHSEVVRRQTLAADLGQSAAVRRLQPRAERPAGRAARRLGRFP